MSKKRAKNSDYHYVERRDNAERDRARKEAQRKVGRRERFMYLLGFFLLIAALILWILSRKNGLSETLSPLYGAISGGGLILLSRSYTRDRPRAAKACIVTGVVALILSAGIFLINIGVITLS